MKTTNTARAREGKVRQPGRAIFVIDMKHLTEGRTGVDPAELSRWLDKMDVAHRIVIASPFGTSWPTDTAWSRFGFTIHQTGADNDNFPAELARFAARFPRVFVATSPREFGHWQSALTEVPVLVGCIRNAAQPIAPEVRARATALYFLQRFMFPLPPALNWAA